MNTKRTAALFPLVVTLVASTLGLAVSVQAQTYTILHSFANNANGYNPAGSLVFDRAGNLYGTTSEGGNFTGCSTGCGVVFELSSGSGGNWRERVIHTFAGSNGANPFVGLVADGSGNFYGATGDGGLNGAGTIFKLSRHSGGGWRMSFVHVFTGGVDGANPYSNLIVDSAGNLYGTAHRGGNSTCDCGVVFKMSPTVSGDWKETVILPFSNRGGAYPEANVLFDAAGNLWSTTAFGGVERTVNGYKPCPVDSYGICGYGTLFELSLTASGRWKETLIYAFKGQFDGAYPASALVIDPAGNLYGTTQTGGTPNGCDIGGCGVVFEVSPLNGGWTVTTLHAFIGSDGQFPVAGLILDAGALYGTTSAGGTYNCGVVFKLEPASGGGWTESTAHTFDGTDGCEPQASLISDSLGNLYGTAASGGANALGTVFEIEP